MSRVKVLFEPSRGKSYLNQHRRLPGNLHLRSPLPSAFPFNNYAVEWLLDLTIINQPVERLILPFLSSQPFQPHNWLLGVERAHYLT